METLDSSCSQCCHLADIIYTLANLHSFCILKTKIPLSPISLRGVVVIALDSRLTDAGFDPSHLPHSHSFISHKYTINIQAHPLPIITWSFLRTNIHGVSVVGSRRRWRVAGLKEAPGIICKRNLNFDLVVNIASSL